MVNPDAPGTPSIPGIPSGSRLPIVVDVNLEPDLRCPPVGRAATWDGVDATVGLVEAWRAGADDRRVTWLWRCDPQVGVVNGDPGWALDRWSDQIDAARGRGDTVGIHTHLWRWSEPIGAFVSDAANADWKTECVGRSVETFTRVAGAPPTVGQMGDAYMDAVILAAYLEHDLRIDLTVEPGAPARERMVHTEYVTGTMPDRRRSPRVPYHPRTNDPLRSARRRTGPLTMIPTTTAATPLVVDGVVVDPPGTAANFGVAPERFRHAVTTGLAASVRAGTPYVHVLARSDIGIDAALAQNAARNLEWLAGGMRGAADPWGGVEFVTPEQLLTRTTAG